AHAGGTGTPTNGAAGQLGLGGQGGQDDGGGGGGGYYGGGGGGGTGSTVNSAGAGGGGSGFIDPASSVHVAKSGVRAGDGFVNLTYSGGTPCPNVGGPATALVSRADGAGGATAGVGYSPSISGNGRFVAFESTSPLTGEPIGGLQVFVRDRLTGRTTLVSRGDGATGALPNAFSDAPSISADGRYVAFESVATNLVPGFVAPTNRSSPCTDSDNAEGHGSGDVFVRDLVAKTTRLVSHVPGSTTTPGSAYSEDPAISRDGSRIIFNSASTNLLTTPLTKVNPCDPQVFATPRAGGDAVLASNADGAALAPSNHITDAWAISGDGNVVAFVTPGTNLVSGVTTPDETYIRNLTAHTTIVASRGTGSGSDPGPVSNDGSGRGATGSPSLSQDGSHVLFQSEGINLGGPTDHSQQIYVRNVAAKTLTLASRSPGIGPAGGPAGSLDSGPAVITPSGRFVAFETNAPNLSGLNVGSVVVRDLTDNTLALVSRASGPNGAPGNNTSEDIAISDDGQTIAFESRSTNLTADNTNNGAQVFVRGPNVQPTPDRFIQAAYADFLRRAPSSGEVSAGKAQLAGGTSDQAFALSLANRAEYVGVLVDRFYTDTLGRPGEPSGRAYWINQIISRARTVAQVAAYFYASPEYYNGIGGGTDESWIKDLYQKLLHRTADSGGLAYWKGQIVSAGRDDVANRFYQSLESRADRVTKLYEELLGRAPDAGGRSYWAGRILNEGDIALASFLAGSSEYYQRAQTRFP
ncbi:MAG: domain protein beta Propeller, partial [Acidimicrobiales bacterium]|nr:domain protein beta Propeller [Acidimicrobiales bacterium]